jgi:hypothetical protein
LETGLLYVVAVQMDVSESMDEFPRFQVANLGHHQGQQGVAGDIEGNAEENIGAALV